MSRRRPQFAFTSPQAHPDVERLRQEVERALQLLRGGVDRDVAGLVTTDAELDALTTTVATMATTIVTDHGGLTGLGDDDHAQYLRADGTRPLSANWAAGSFDITGLDALGAASLTLTGNVDQASASPVYYLGNGTGSPTWLANKSDAGDIYAPLYRVAGVNRWAWYMATDEDFQLLRWNASGVFQDLTEVSATDGRWSFPAAVRVGNYLEVASGGAEITGTLNVIGSITVSGTVDGVDVADHSARHENGGADEISVEGLSGLLADAQTPLAHDHVDGYSTVYALNTTSQVTSNTTTVTDMVGATLVGGDFVAGDAIRLRLGGRYVNSSGSSRTFDLILSIGGTTLWQDGSNSNGSSALYTAWEIEVIIYVVSTTSVRMTGRVRQHTTNAPTAGLGDLSSALRMDAAIATQDAVTIPTLASNRTLTLSVQHSFAASTITIERYGYAVERLAA
jgi:hypothetical protein